MATVKSIQFDRENTGAEHGIKGGRPAKYDWPSFEKEMNENDPDKYYLSPHMKKWMIENWGVTQDFINQTLRKTLWSRYNNKTDKQKAAAKALASQRRQSVRGRLAKRMRSFKNRGERSYEWGIKELVAHLEKTQYLDLGDETIIDYFDGTLLNLSSESWQLDHLNGSHDSSLENLVLTREQYNQMKNMWSLEETLDACERLLKCWRPEKLK